MKIRNLVLFILLGAVALLGVGCHNSGGSFSSGEIDSGGDDSILGSLLSVAVVRLDGSKIELLDGSDASPIPLKFSSIDATFDASALDLSADSSFNTLSSTDDATDPEDVFLLTCDGQAVEGGYSWSEGNTLLRFVPDNPLSNAADCSVAIEGSDGDAQSISFVVMIKGDVDGDGFADILIGAPADGAPPSNPLASVASGIDFAEAAPVTGPGAVYIYSGGRSSLGNLITKISGMTDSDSLGALVAHAGDVNGDGYADIMVGAPGVMGDPHAAFSTAAPGIDFMHVAPVLTKGAVYIFAGGPDLSATMYSNSALAKIMGAVDGDGFGVSIASAGDVNDDGFDDILVGAPNAGTGGRAYIFNGRSDLDVFVTSADNANVKIVGEYDTSFGTSVASAGDVTGNEIPDIIVGAPDGGSEENGPGTVYIFEGGADLTGNLVADGAKFVIVGGDSAKDYNVQFGSSVAGAGRVDGDDRNDIIVGALKVPAVYLFSGADLDPDSIMTFADNFAKIEGVTGFLAGPGDVDGDTHADIVVSTGGGLFGDLPAVHLFSGVGLDGEMAIDDADIVIEAMDSKDAFGFSLAGAGDVNGDGFADILVGAPGVGTGGSVYLFSGDPLTAVSDEDPTPDGAKVIFEGGYKVDGNASSSVPGAR